MVSIRHLYNNKIMITSKDGINLIKKFESLHDGDLSLIGLQPKMCPALIWTEGFGRAMRDNKGNFIKGADKKELAYANISIHTPGEADKALAQDLQSFELSVSRAIKVPLNQSQFDSLVSYWYNTGGSSTLAKLINGNSSKEEIYNWFTTKYITGGGVTLKGLINRRKEEADLYFKK